MTLTGLQKSEAEDRRTTWADLPPELRRRIVSYLPPNDVALAINVINKAAADEFRDFRLVRLSEPTPHAAFARRWGGPHSMQDAPLKLRERFVALVAYSGILANLELALVVAGCALKHGAFAAAAAGGHIEVCEWLMARGCPHSPLVASGRAAAGGHMALVRWILQRDGLAAPDRRRLGEAAWAAAAAAGQRGVCEGLLEDGISPGIRAVHEAARGGNTDLTFWLLTLPETPPVVAAADVAALLRNASYGMELRSLQRLCEGWFGLSRCCEAAAAAATTSRGEPQDDNWARMVSEALVSPTHDWLDKVQWLEAQGAAAAGAASAAGGGDAGGAAAAAAATAVHQQVNWSELVRLPDALARLAFLQQRAAAPLPRLGAAESDAVGTKINPGTVLLATACCGNLTLLRQLRAGGYRFSQATALADAAADRYVVWWATKAAADAGDVALLAELVKLGCPLTPEVALAALRSGHLRILEWMSGPDGGKAGRASVAALRVAAVPRLAEFAAAAGSVELMAWLWERNACKWERRAFAAAVLSGGVPLVEWLVARGCPMTEDDDPYLLAGHNGDLSMLTCLRRLGCPWDLRGSTFIRAVFDYSDFRTAPSGLPVLAWLLEQGCPVDWKKARRHARMRDEPEVLEWMEGRLTPPPPPPPLSREGVIRRLVRMLLRRNGGKKGRSG